MSIQRWLLRRDARAKLFSALAVVIVIVSTPPAHKMAFFVYAALLAGFYSIARLSWRTLLRRFLAIAPVVVACAVFLPFVAHGAPNGGAGLLVWNLAGKATLGVLCITLLNECTPFPDLLHALEHLRVPRLLVVVLGFTHRYAFVVVEEARRMVRARDARAWRGRRLSDAPVIGRMVGALFLRSYERSERIHLAMLARGFHGHMPGNAPHELRAGDYVFFAVTLLIFLALRVELCR